VHKILCTRGPSETITYKWRKSVQAHKTLGKENKDRVCCAVRSGAQLLLRASLCISQVPWTA
jgi:hypothetical protein